MKVFLNILDDLQILETDAIVLQFLMEIWLIQFLLAYMVLINKSQMDKNFQMLVKSYKKLWLMKAELKRLEIHKSPMKSLIVLFMCLCVIPIVRTMKVKMYILLNSFGPPMINLAFVVLSNRFTKISKKDLLLMYPNVREYSMNCIKMDTSRCRMSYCRLKN